MLAGERLVLQYTKESADDYRLVIVIRTGCASVTDRRCDRVGSGFQFIERLSLGNKWGELATQI